MTNILEKSRMGADSSIRPLPPNANPAERWRFRRNLVIYLAHHRNGLSQRFLADVFDLPPSRITEIVREMSAYERRATEP